MSTWADLEAGFDEHERNRRMASTARSMALRAAAGVQAQGRRVDAALKQAQRARNALIRERDELMRRCELAEILAELTGEAMARFGEGKSKWEPAETAAEVA